MRPVVLVAAIGASAVLGGVIGGAVVRTIDRPELAEAMADNAKAVWLMNGTDRDLVDLSGLVQRVNVRLHELEQVVGGCSCPKPR